MSDKTWSVEDPTPEDLRPPEGNADHEHHEDEPDEAEWLGEDF